MQNFLSKYNIQYFYHFTDKSNLESIQEKGIFPLSEIKQQNINPVFGGNDWSHKTDVRFGVDKYIHLAFNPKKSFSCQARSSAILVAMLKLDILEDSISSQNKFIEKTYVKTKKQEFLPLT